MSSGLALNPSRFAIGFTRNAGLGSCPPGYIVAGYNPFPQPICVIPPAGGGGTQVASGSFCGAGLVGTSILCKGYDPVAGCPPGFTRVSNAGWSLKFMFWTCWSP